MSAFVTDDADNYIHIYKCLSFFMGCKTIHFNAIYWIFDVQLLQQYLCREKNVKTVSKTFVKVLFFVARNIAFHLINAENLM